MYVKRFGDPTLIVRFWPFAIRWTWPVKTPGGFYCGQDTTQIGFSWPPGPRLPRWSETNPRAAWMDRRD
jgi:hypothetical protein